MSNEEKITVDQYGRKKWNLEVYAKEAKDKKNKSKNQTDEQQLSKKYGLDPNSNDTSKAYIKHRDDLLKTSLDAVKTYNLINPDNDNLSSFGANKRFGFFCPVCDLSFRDNLSLIDHLNSPQHINKIIQLNQKEGQNDDTNEILDGGIRRASLKEVIMTMEKLIKQKIAEKNDQDMESAGGLTFSERIERRKLFEENKREKRLSKRQLQKQRKKQKIEDEKASYQQSESDINNMMGFGNFGSTKSK
ncbi:SNU23 [Candida pseudojiufengensis]|uniref:SNU23 n=1 Tax=Candida pseudojiufengensis TaxID=497109 RepID=UPI0022251711|nr:SNU23 [Candida pseudojiufengensis]KAI5960192.1 SNU23 [Candida pseudojiufengensis]